MTEALSVVVVSLMKGIADRESDPVLWQSLIGIQARVRDFVACLGLDLVLDEAEGFAYLRQRPAEAGVPELPRLVPRRQLDATSGETRLILGRDDIVEMMRLFLAETANQVRLNDRIGADINRVVDMGFLRRLRGTNDRFEVRRILKAFVDAQWLADFDQRLAAYQSHSSSEQAAIE
jgi:hypothetical protein